MPVTSIELIGRRVSGSSSIRRYYFHGPATEAEVITAYTNTTKIPPSVSGLPLASIESEEVQDIAGDWLTVATYGLSNSGTPLQPQPKSPKVIRTARSRPLSAFASNHSMKNCERAVFAPSKFSFPVSSSKTTASCQTTSW